MVHVKQTLETLRHHQFFAKVGKCVFGQQELEYLGHIVSKEGVSADASKIQAMLDWPTPRSLKELRGFLGLTGYYRRFVEGYGRISWPLTQQLKKDAFQWNSEAEEAFQHLKKAMTEIPVLPTFRCLMLRDSA